LPFSFSPTFCILPALACSFVPAQVEKLVRQMFIHVHAYELQALCDFWDHLSRRFFSRLERSFMLSVRKLEYCLKRYYLVSVLNGV
jgi:hypothetical protein